jgi:type 1 glutamine amidotransferase
VPAVNLHCAVHSYRTGTDAWFAFLGLQSSGHGPQEPIAVAFLPDASPITRGMADFTTGKEELYNNVKLFDTARPLARGKQSQRRKDGTTKDEEFVVAWTNDYGGTRVFSTTLGHNDALVEDERYLELVTRGLLWATGKLDDAGRPRRGYARTPAAAPKAAAR